MTLLTTLRLMEGNHVAQRAKIFVRKKCR